MLLHWKRIRSNSTSRSRDKHRITILLHKDEINELILHTTGSTFPNLKSDELKEFIFPLLPIAEQTILVKEIGNHFLIADNTEKVLEQSLNGARVLRQSILKRAFDGKLVLQDPSEEPANILFQKMKEETSSKQMKWINDH